MHAYMIETTGVRSSQMPVVSAFRPRSNHRFRDSVQLFPLKLKDIAWAKRFRRMLIARAVFGCTAYRTRLSNCNDPAYG